MYEYDLSPHGKSLIELYKLMVSDGYKRTDGSTVMNVYADFELKKFRKLIKPKLSSEEILTVLDYGGGGCDWLAPGFDNCSNASALSYFNLQQATVFEPARNKTLKYPADAVICIDVLEHIFISDLPHIVEELFCLSNKLLVINVACYRAAALLPNGENAHVTVRSPDYWKGLIDGISVRYPDIEVMLICSETHKSGVIFDCFKSSDWSNSKTYSIDSKLRGFHIAA